MIYSASTLYCTYFYNFFPSPSHSGPLWSLSSFQCSRFKGFVSMKKKTERLNVIRLNCFDSENSYQFIWILFDSFIDANHYHSNVLELVKKFIRFFFLSDPKILILRKAN